jgi:uncharacterized protein YndB with AHSA1/START domain
MHGILEAGPRLRFTRHLAHPPEKVWRAVTEPEHLEHWFPDTIVVERWEVGAPLHFEHPGVYSFEGEVLALEPGTMWAIRWGTDEIRVELEPDGEGTKLTLLDTFDEYGKAARDAAGWHACLDQLEQELGEQVRVASWNDVHPGYVDSFGPEAATIGPPEGVTTD